MPDLSWNFIGAIAAKPTAPASPYVTLTISKGDIAAILAKLQIGDVIKAVVLRPQLGQDFIEIAGQSLPAQLPPDVFPGETLALQVTDLTSDTLTVRNLGPLPQPQSAPAPESGAQPAAQPRPPGVPPFVMVSPSNRAPATLRPEILAVQTAVKQIARSVTDLLKSVKFPDTPLTRTIAAVAPQAPQRIPQVLARLEAALPRESTDPRIATLKTLIAFTSRLNLENESTLPAQIEAYLSHVLEGAEPKLSQLLQALSQTSQQAPAQRSTADSNVAPSPSADDAAPQSPLVMVPSNHGRATPSPDDTSQNNATTVAQARAAERSAAIDYDLKSVVLSLLRNPPQDRTPQFAQALNEAQITLTAAQFNALSSTAQTPGTIAFSLPAYFHEGGKPAHVRISRDRDGAGKRLTADDFHVAFVLDTANLGTVAIDLHSSGRSVKIDVKTERRSAAATFSDTLSALRARLEHLRYRVASAGATALDRKPQTPAQQTAGLDLRA